MEGSSKATYSQIPSWGVRDTQRKSDDVRPVELSQSRSTGQPEADLQIWLWMQRGGVDRRAHIERRDPNRTRNS